VDPSDAPPTLPLESPHHGYRGERGAVTPAAVPAALSIAVSREAGARGGTIGRRVGRKLGWQVYDQELLEYLVQDSNVQQGLAENLSEAGRRWVEEQLQKLTTAGELDQTPAILNLARLGLSLGAQGRVVLIGRGAGFLLPRATTLHVRLVAPLEDRVAYLSQCLRLTLEEARQRVRLRDARRTEYLTAFLHREAADLCDYDMILNTSSLGEEPCAELIVQAARAKAALRFNTEDAESSSSEPT
jgi:cytidylate kinase